MKKKLPGIILFIKKRYYFVLAFVILLIVSLGYFSSKNSQKKITYQTTVAAKKTLVSAVSVSGQVVAAGNMPILTQATGVIQTVYVKNGDTVQKGQKIIELSLDQQGIQKQTQVWSSYLSAKSTLESAQASLYTLQSDMLSKWKLYIDLAQGPTYENNDESPRLDNRTLPQFMTVEDDWLASEAKYKNQQTVISQAQAAMASAWSNYQAASPTVLALVSGTIANLTYVPGMTVGTIPTTSNTSATYVKLGDIKTDNSPVATFNLSEADVVKAKAGQKATITVDAIPEKSFSGKVMGIDTSGVISSGVTNYSVTIIFDNLAEGLLPNMSATANIITEIKDNVISIPTSAVQTVDGESVVRVMKKGNILETKVEIGLVSDTETEVILGINEGDTVVTGTINSSSSNTNNKSVFGSQMGGFGGAMRVGGGGR